ncbi:MAG: glycosyltransferase, partial [Synechococcaceae cyanobacterium]|nr:glycosyltransferase [Synechococcaceae cyanobacterium]
MPLIAIVSHDVQTVNGRGGGVAAFTLHWLQLLRAHRPEDRLRLIYTSTYAGPQRIDPSWRARYEGWGIELVECHAPESDIERGPTIGEQILAEQVAPHLADADVVYVADWGHAGFHFLRQRHLRGARTPVCATVAHGGTEWLIQGREIFVRDASDHHRAFIERYGLAHSDVLISPSRYMLTWLQEAGCRLPPPEQQRVVGLPLVVDDPVDVPVPAPSRVTAGGRFRCLVFFNGRLERRKGIELFVAGLEQVVAQGGLDGLEEVVLLAAAVPAQEESLRVLGERLRRLGPRLRVVDDHDSVAAQSFLRQRAADALVIIPSLLDNFPYAVIEASRIPGLNLLCTAVGGIPEIVGEDSPRLFPPTPTGLAAKLTATWARGPQADDAPYDAERANRTWLALHDELLDRSRGPAPPPQSRRPRVDVCVPFYNAGRFLPQLLASLSRQNYPSLNVIVVDDGSNDPYSTRAFVDQRLRHPGWTFHRQPNRFVDAARNRAASLGEGELLLFVDADDVLAPDAVARLVDALERSGVDALTANARLFASLELPVRWPSGEPACRIEQRLTPLGPSLVSGLLNPQVFGTCLLLVRRAVFEAIGGYTCWPGAGHEDWELTVRLALAGFHIDVLPEDLLYVRGLGGGLSARLDPLDCRRRLVRPYDRALAPLGLHGMAQLVLGLLDENVHLRQRLRRIERRAELRRRPYRIVSELERDLHLSLPRLTPKELLRYVYRRLVPLPTRLRLHERIAPLA